MDPVAEIVERELTEDLLTAGELVFGPVQAERLKMPEYSGDVTVTHAGESFECRWDATSRRLGGEILQEVLQLEAQIGDSYRVSRDGDLIRLIVSARGATVLRPPIEQPESVPPTRTKGTRRRRSAAQPLYEARREEDFDWLGNVGLHRESTRTLVHQMEKGGWDPLEDFELRIAGEELAAVNDFDELLAVDLARVEHMPHQEAAAVKVLADMYGRAILADEVGLGKTIEAGLIAKELLTRGMAHRILVVCPASLRDQWKEEMKEKFDEDFEIAWSAGTAFNHDRLIVSADLAIRNPNMRRLQNSEWDLVIVDEAHRFGTAGARSRPQLVRGLETRYLLFLTATPVQNSLLELYRLVDLLRPGTFSSQRDFKARYLDPNDERRPRDPVQLRRLVSEVMVRTTREQAGLDNVTRYPRDIPVHLGRTERQAYDLVVRVLRSVMTDRSDNLKRRILAQRLTASPRALLTSAKRMSENHPNPEVRGVLGELAELALDFPVTNRQKKLIELCREWIEDRSGKGKVLVFTQHTDTLSDLVRVLEADGISTVSFHGGLSAQRRRRAIEEFRSSVPVMVSTDSGAEGLNLQFANCVINYDLPWNPMKIEQRIGRVHRVTQTRDVFVANFFAKDTVDEHLYQILHDKLRMFELLFGQVTTVLGELDRSFEQSILEAVESSNDAMMADRLEELGAKIADARDEADRAIRDGGHLNAWVTDPSHRQAVESQRGDELVPYIELKQRQREEKAEAFIRHYMEILGATVVHEADRFVTLALPPQLKTEFGVPDLHLAFSTDALGEHPNAELCTVGSALFDELLSAIRRHGDLLARVPVVPELEGRAPLSAVDGLSFVDRTVRGSTDEALTATWRARDDRSITGAQIVTTFHGRRDESWDAVEYRSLDDGESLPQSLGDPGLLVRAVSEGAVEQLEECRARLQVDVNRRHSDDHERMRTYYDRQIEDRSAQRTRSHSQARKDEHSAAIRKLEAARDELDLRTGPDLKLEADLLALRIEAAPVIRVEERWEDSLGPFVVDVEWDLRSNSYIHKAPDGAAINTLALCGNRHATDETRTRRCDCCEELICDSCSDRWVFAECDICGTEVCGECLPESERSQPKKACRACRQPKRTQDHDTEYAIGFSMGGGVGLLVGERTATLNYPDGRPPLAIVPDGDVDDEARIRARRLAAAHNLPLDSPVVWAGDALAAEESGQLAQVVLDTTIEWSIETDRTGEMSSRAAAALAVEEHDEPDVLSERGAGLEHVLRQCRESASCPASPAIVVTPYATVRKTLLRESGLLERTVRVGEGREPEVVSEQGHSVLSVADDSEPGFRVGFARGADMTVTIRRFNHSYLLEADGSVSQRWFAKAPGAGSFVDEAVWAEVAARAGIPGGLVWADNDTLPASSEVRAIPTRPMLQASEERETWIVSKGTGSERPGSPSDYELEAPEVHADPVEEAPQGLAEAVCAIAGPIDSPGDLVVGSARYCTDVWSDRTDSEIRYVISAREPLIVPNDATWVCAGASLAPRTADGKALDDFEIDSFGHIHEVGAESQCPACERWSCSECGEAGALAACPECAQDACGRCRGQSHVGIDTATCGRCGSRSCSACGRDIQARECDLCRRAICKHCRGGSVCATCATLAPPPPGWSPPGVLHAHNLGILVSSDIGHDQVVLLAGAERRETAVVAADGRDVVTWNDHSASTRDRRVLELAVLEHVGCDKSELRLEVSRSGEAASPPEGAHILHRHNVTRLSLELGTDTKRVSIGDVLEDLAGATDGDIIRNAPTLMGLPEVIAPEPNHPTPSLALQLRELAGSTNADSAVLRLEVCVDERTVWADEVGLHSHVSTESDTELAPWATTPPRRWAVETWEHAPLDALTASGADDAEVVLLRQGSFAVLATRIDTRLAWYRIDGSPSAVVGGAVGSALFSPGVVAEVVKATLPDSVTGPMVVGYEFESREARPQPKEMNGQPDAGLTARVLSEVLEESVSFPRWELKELDTSARDAFRSLVRERLPQDVRKVGVGLAVRETWKRNGRVVEIDYMLEPGDRSGTVKTRDSDEPTDKVHVDRSGHVVANPRVCRYCKTATCFKCEARTLICPLCGIDLCGRCRDEADGGLCNACGSLERSGRFSHRSEKKRFHWKGRILVGSDAQHTVLAGRTGDGRWQVVATAEDDLGTAEPRDVQVGAQARLEHVMNGGTK